MTNKKPKWEEEFDKFIDSLPKYVGQTPRSVFKQFISRQIEQARKEERERIIKEIKEEVRLHFKHPRTLEHECFKEIFEALKEL